MKELIIRITGAVQEQNLKEFEDSAMSVLNSINTELVTDNDFAEAEQAIKDCKTVETRIASAKQQALHDMSSVSELFTLVDKLSDKFRTTRLDLERKVKAEKAQRKTDIVNGYRDRLKATVKQYPCSHAFDLARIDFNQCVKGKRSLVEMDKACNALYVEHLESLGDMIETYAENISAIAATDSEFPGLFPDRENIAVEPVFVVKSLIDSRIAKHKLAIKEKEEAERLQAEREAAARIEAERLKTETAIKEKEEREAVISEATAMPESSIPAPPSFSSTPPPPSFLEEDMPAMKKEYRIVITFYGADDEASKFSDVLKKFPGVMSATIEETEEAF